MAVVIWRLSGQIQYNAAPSDSNGLIALVDVQYWNISHTHPSHLKAVFELVSVDRKYMSLQPTDMHKICQVNRLLVHNSKGSF